MTNYRVYGRFFYRCLLYTLQHTRPSIVSEALCSPNLPLHAGYADLQARLLIVVEPLAVGEVDGSKAGSGIYPLCLKFALGLELRELESSTVDFKHGERLRGVGVRVRSRRGLDAGRMLPLAIPASPDKVGLAFAAAELGLVEAVEGDVIGVCFATRGALDGECVEEGSVGRVGGSEVGDAVELCLEGECEHHDGG